MKALSIALLLALAVVAGVGVAQAEDEITDLMGINSIQAD